MLAFPGRSRSWMREHDDRLQEYRGIRSLDADMGHCVRTLRRRPVCKGFAKLVSWEYQRSLSYSQLHLAFSEPFSSNDMNISVQSSQIVQKDDKSHSACSAFRSGPSIDSQLILCTNKGPTCHNSCKAKTLSSIDFLVSWSISCFSFSSCALALSQMSISSAWATSRSLWSLSSMIVSASQSG